MNRNRDEKGKKTQRRRQKENPSTTPRTSDDTWNSFIRNLQRTKHPNRMVCSLCNQSGHNKLTCKVVAHEGQPIVAEEEETIEYICVQCRLPFPTEHAARQHLRSCKPPVWKTCRHCQKVFRSGFDCSSHQTRCGLANAIPVPK